MIIVTIHVITMNNRIVQWFVTLCRGSQACSSSILYDTLEVLSHYVGVDLYDFIVLTFTILIIAAVQYLNPATEGSAFFYLAILFLELLLIAIKKYVWKRRGRPRVMIIDDAGLWINAREWYSKLLEREKKRCPE